MDQKILITITLPKDRTQEEESFALVLLKEWLSKNSIWPSSKLRVNSISIAQPLIIDSDTNTPCPIHIDEYCKRHGLSR